MNNKLFMLFIAVLFLVNIYGQKDQLDNLKDQIDEYIEDVKVTKIAAEESKKAYNHAVETLEEAKNAAKLAQKQYEEAQQAISESVQQQYYAQRQRDISLQASNAKPEDINLKNQADTEALNFDQVNKLHEKNIEDYDKAQKELKQTQKQLREAQDNMETTKIIAKLDFIESNQTLLIQNYEEQIYNQFLEISKYLKALQEKAKN